MLTHLPKLVILDRDGVINIDSENYIRTVNQWSWINQSDTALCRLIDAQIPVAIATNQSGLSRGFFDYATLHRMHQKLLDGLGQHAKGIQYIAICPHHPSDGCECRKPAPGMLNEIANKLSVSLGGDVHFVGDSWRDCQAALAVNCQPILVKTGKGQKTLNQLSAAQRQAIPTFDNLNDYVKEVLCNI